MKYEKNWYISLKFGWKIIKHLVKKDIFIDFDQYFAFYSCISVNILLNFWWFFFSFMVNFHLFCNIFLWFLKKSWWILAIFQTPQVNFLLFFNVFSWFLSIFFAFFPYFCRCFSRFSLILDDVLCTMGQFSL